MQNKESQISNIKCQISDVKSQRSRSGFTLVELIVAIGLFAVISSIAVGGFVQALRTQRRASALIAANSNAFLAIEQMTREIRTGRVFCATRLQGGDQVGTINLPSCIAYFQNRSQIGFFSATGETVQYRLFGGTIQRRSGGGDWGPITGGKVLVFDLQFHISGQGEDDNLQPRVTISLGVSTKESGLQSNVTRFQTTVSSRARDE